MTLYDLMMGAQGGQAVNALANQFGLSMQQTQAALQAMMPAFSAGFQKTMSDPMGFGALMNQMNNNAFAQFYANPAQTPAAATGLGGNVVGQIFGSQQIQSQVSQQAAQASGVSAQIIQQMLPIVASMLIGGVSSAMAAQGLGGLVTQLATNAAQNVKAPTPGFDPNQMFTNWMSMVNAMMTGMAGATGAATPQAVAMQTGLKALDTLMQAGVQVSQAQQKGFNDLIAAMGKTSQA